MERHFVLVLWVLLLLRFIDLGVLFFLLSCGSKSFFFFLFYILGCGHACGFTILNG